MADTQEAASGAEKREDQQYEQQQQDQHEQQQLQDDEEEEQQKDGDDGEKYQQEEQMEDCHVRAVLKEDHGSEAGLESWASEGFTNKGDHYLCTIRRINVTFSLTGRRQQVSYVAKIKQGIVEGLRDFGDMSFEKECLMYGTLVPALNEELMVGNLEALRLPRCYFHCLEEGREVIVLEDLSRSGFKMASRQSGLDKAHAILVVREIARLHASSLLYQATLPSHNLALHHPLLQKEWSNYSKTSEGQLEVLLKSDMILLASVAESARRPRSEVAWLKDLSTRALQVFNQQLTTAPPFAVLCHGDCWTNNFLFRYDDGGRPVEVRMLDVSISRRGSVALDLHTLIYSSLGVELRRASLESLLQEYHDSLSHVMQARDVPIPFTYEELVAEYHDKSLYGLLMGADYLPVVMVEATDAPDFSLLSRGEEFLKHRKETLATVLVRNPHLTPLILHLLDDMGDLGVYEADQTTHM